MTRQEKITGHRQCINIATHCREMNQRDGEIIWLDLASGWRRDIAMTNEQAAQEAIADHRTKAQAQRMGMWE